RRLLRVAEPPPPPAPDAAFRGDKGVESIPPHGPTATPTPVLLFPTEPAPAAVPEAVVAAEAPPPWKRLERLLAGCQDVDTLTATERVNALLWLGQSPEEHLAALPTPVQWALARLLGLANRADDSISA